MDFNGINTVPSVEIENNTYFLAYRGKVGSAYDPLSQEFVRAASDQGLRVTRLTLGDIEGLGVGISLPFMGYLQRNVNPDLFRGWSTRLPVGYHNHFKEREYQKI